MKATIHQKNYSDNNGAKRANKKSKRRFNNSEDDFSRKEIKQRYISRKEKLDLIRLEEMAELEDLIEVYR